MNILSCDSYATTLDLGRLLFFSDFFSLIVSKAKLDRLEDRSGEVGASVLLRLRELFLRGDGGQSLAIVLELLLLFSLEDDGFLEEEDFFFDEDLDDVGFFPVGEEGGVERISEACTAKADMDLILRGPRVFDFLELLLLDFFFFFFFSSSGTSTMNPSPTSFGSFLLLLLGLCLV